MSLFEYLSVAISIVLSMSIVRSLEAVGDVLDPARRDRIHVIWFLVKAFEPALVWWTIWGLQDEANWTYPAFLLCLAGPVLLFFQITTLTTREPDEVADWGAHFMASRRRFFGGFIAGAASGPALVASFGHLDTAAYLLIVAAFDTALGVTGIVSTNRRVHLTLGVIVVVRVIFATVAIYEPIGSDGLF